MSKRLKIILGVVGAVVVLGTAATIFFWPAISGFAATFFAQKSDENTDELTNSEVIIQTDNDLFDEALEAAQSGGGEAGQQVLDQKLEKTEDKTTKSVIYSQKAALALSPQGGNNKATALEYAYQAEAENPTYATAILIADLEYYDMNNKTNGLKYYKLYLERLTGSAEAVNPGDKEYYQNLIREIEASL